MTLPTRPDGGIDWEKIIFPDAAYMTYGWVHKNNEIKRVSMYDFNRLVAAHTRERCIKLIEEEAQLIGEVGTELSSVGGPRGLIMRSQKSILNTLITQLREMED